MAVTEKRKQSLYFPEDMLNEIMKEAIRLDRSLSWIVQHAWRVGSDEVRKFPSVDGLVSAVAGAPRTPRQRPPPTPESQTVSTPDRQPGSQVREFLNGKFENK